MTAHPELFDALFRPFQPNEERTKKGTGHKYITARTVQNRLDEVMGPENWRATFREVDRGVVCELWVRLPSGEWLSKQDAGGHSDMVQKHNGEIVDDDENSLKSGYSDALKRAAAAWGIGRYLYGDGYPRFGAPAAPREGPRRAAGRAARAEGDGGEWTGARLYRWSRAQDEAAEGLGLTDWLAAKCRGAWGARKLLDLTPEQAAKAHQSALRRIHELATSEEVQAALPPGDEISDGPYVRTGNPVK